MLSAAVSNTEIEALFVFNGRQKLHGDSSCIKSNLVKCKLFVFN